MQSDPSFPAPGTEIMHVSITRDDIAKAAKEVHPYQLPSPLVFALERETNKSWRDVQNTLMVEKEAPFQVLQVPAPLRERIRMFQDGGELEPFIATLAVLR